MGNFEKEMIKTDNTIEKIKNNTNIYLRETAIFYTWANRVKKKIEEIDDIKDLNEVWDIFKNVSAALNNIGSIKPDFLDIEDVNSVIDERGEDRFEIARFLSEQSLWDKWEEMEGLKKEIQYRIEELESTLYTKSVIQEIEEIESKVSVKEAEKSLMMKDEELKDLREKIEKVTDVLFESLSEDEKKIKIEIEVVALLKLIDKFKRQFRKAGALHKELEVISKKNKNIKIFLERLKKKNEEAERMKKISRIVEEEKNKIKNLEYGTIILFDDRNPRMTASCTFVKGDGDKYYGYNSVFTLDELIGWGDKEVDLRTFYSIIDDSDEGKEKGKKIIDEYYEKKKAEIGKMKNTIGV